MSNLIGAYEYNGWHIAIFVVPSRSPLHYGTEFAVKMQKLQARESHRPPRGFENLSHAKTYAEWYAETH